MSALALFNQRLALFNQHLSGNLEALLGTPGLDPRVVRPDENMVTTRAIAATCAYCARADGPLAGRCRGCGAPR